MNEAAIDVDEEARAVAAVLSEFTTKLTAINKDLLEALDTTSAVYKAWNPSYFAFLLDRFEMINRPLQRVLSRGSGLVEHSALTPRVRDEMDLRMRDLEAQLHHAERQTRALHELLGYYKTNLEVAKLRYAAGLPAAPRS